MENSGSPNLKELVDLMIQSFPPLDEARRRVVVATYRRLALGRPASPDDIARDAGIDSERVDRILGEWTGVYRDDSRSVIGFWGLTIEKMKHRFEVDGVGLYTWCAWDTFFLPELLGKSARVASTCPSSGERVTLTVSPNGIESVQPDSVCLSFLIPDRARVQQNVIANFCHFVHFFRSRKDAENWIEKTPGTFILSLNQGMELARRKNQLQFGAGLH